MSLSRKRDTRSERIAHHEILHHVHTARRDFCSVTGVFSLNESQARSALESCPTRVGAFASWRGDTIQPLGLDPYSLHVKCCTATPWAGTATCWLPIAPVSQPIRLFMGVNCSFSNEGAIGITSQGDTDHVQMVLLCRQRRDSTTPVTDSGRRKGTQVSQSGEQLKSGQLGTVDVTASTVANIGPGIDFNFAFGVIAVTAGVAAPLTIIAAGLAVVLLAFTVAEFTKAEPSAGSFITYEGIEDTPQAG